MNALASPYKMIYNVYHKGGDTMNAVVSKWGNSLGIRIPAMITDSLDLKAGDKVSVELKDKGMFFKKEQSTVEMFEAFYGKPFSEINEADLGPANEFDWGEDVGNEVI